MTYCGPRLTKLIDCENLVRRYAGQAAEDVSQNGTEDFYESPGKNVNEIEKVQTPFFRPLRARLGAGRDDARCRAATSGFYSSWTATSGNLRACAPSFVLSFDSDQFPAQESGKAVDPIQ